MSTTTTTANTTVVYALFDVLDHGRYAPLTREPRERFTTGLCHLKLIITIPDGYRIGTNDSGDVLLVNINGDAINNHRIAYDFYNGCVASVFCGLGAPIKGCHIISREEI